MNEFHSKRKDYGFILSDAYKVFIDGKKAGTATVFLDGDDAILCYSVSNHSYRFFCVVIHDIVCRHHCFRIHVFQDNDVLESLAFVYTENHYIYYVERMRFLLPDSCFDKEGLIIDQGKTENISFGILNSNRNGCGWISVYNFLRINEIYANMEDIIHSMERMSPTLEYFGHDFYSMYRYLKRYIPSVQIVTGDKETLTESMEESQSGILLYKHKTNRHFVAYRRERNGKYHFYNARYGKANLIMSPKQFLDIYSVGKIGVCIYLA